MDSEELLQKYSAIVRRYWLSLFLGVLGLIFLGYGMIGYLQANNDKKDILFDSASTSSSNSFNSNDPADKTKNINSDKPFGFAQGKQSLQQGSIVVDIEGAVQKPGVYKLPLDGRVQDVLIASGGLGKEADRDKVAKNLNLAAKLTDGAKIYIPFIGEAVVAQGANGGAAVMGETTNGVININSASESELDSLPGIGKVTASKIISKRPYWSIEELLQKKIVRQKVFEEIKDKISVY